MIRGGDAFLASKHPHSADPAGSGGRDAWIVATDLDGTLLDRAYDIAAAAESINQVVLNHPAIVGVVLATSKTLSELSSFTNRLSVPPGLVFENGAGHAWPTSNPTTDQATPCYSKELQGLDYQRIRDVLTQIRRRNGYDFVGFGDMSVAALCAATGLSQAGAKNARDRSASEPLLWSDTPIRFEGFRAELAAEGLEISRGGQFHHVGSPCDKWSAVERYRDRLLPNANVLACGDAPNDLSLLANAQRAIVFPDRAGNYLVAKTKRLSHAHAHGPAGWLVAVNEFFTALATPSSPLATPSSPMDASS